MKDFLDLANARYSVRSLCSKPIEQDKLDKIIAAGLTAPTAVNFQPFRIWVIKSAEAKKKLLQTTPFPFVEQAPVSFVIGADTSKAWVRNFDGKCFAEVDASIVTTHMMLEIHDLGLGSTWVGKFDPDKMKELFPEMIGFELVAILPVGYPADDAKPSERHALSRPEIDLVTEL